jgi:hypothetical protein
MADELNMKTGADKELRRARDLFNSNKTQTAINDAILAVTDVTVFDRGRIIGQVFDQLGNFKHIGKGIVGVKRFRSDVTAWAVRQAQLAVALRRLLPELNIQSSHVVTMLFLRLPEFRGDVEDLLIWAAVVAQREQEGLEALSLWITDHRRAVHAGIRSVLRDCMDLGVNDFNPDHEGERPLANLLVQELETQVWREVAYESDKILSNPNKSIRDQLEDRGRWAAWAWKKNQLRQRDKQSQELFIGLDGLETTIEDELGFKENVGVDVQGFMDPRADHNRHIVPGERKRLWNGEYEDERIWTMADVERDLRRAGPFQPNDVYVMAETLMAA